MSGLLKDDYYLSLFIICCILISFSLGLNFGRSSEMTKIVELSIKEGCLLERVKDEISIVDNDHIHCNKIAQNYIEERWNK